MTPETRLTYLRAVSAHAGAVRARLAAAVGSVEDREFSQAIHEIANATEELGGLVELRRQWKDRGAVDGEVCRGEPDLPPEAGFIAALAQALDCDPEDIRRMHR